MTFLKELHLSQLFGISLCLIYRRKNRTVINVGVVEEAFVDAYLKTFAKVISIDPNVNQLQKIDNFFKANDKTNTKHVIHGVALGSVTQDSVIYYYCVTEPGLSTTNKEDYDDMCNECPQLKWDIQNVKMYSLDDLYNDFYKLDLLKIDAENADVDILLGAKNLIKNNLPAIQIEHDGDGVGFSILRSLGYIKVNPPFDTMNSYFVHKNDIHRERIRR